MTVPGEKCVSSSHHRHNYRHREKGLDMRFSERCDARDACDGGLWVFSKGGRLHFVDAFTLFTKPDKPDTGITKPHSYAVFESIIDVGFSKSIL